MRDERYDRLKSANRVLYRATISMNETQRKKDKEWDKLKEEFMGRYGELEERNKTLERQNAILQSVLQANNFSLQGMDNSFGGSGFGGPDNGFGGGMGGGFGGGMGGGF